ncbi:LAME_0B00210g1_1 [Lachancea meyersii CBS 8951]|uniref:LAME_0B00210g1_1 n=1 Tax=Lachancea meyersii CBS 8951 TaxID=1266667 RepID=A0A1G4ISV9_9SACH|nr:LAME_0B00210g1_1 [Lachancea meyersii CBS 8951]
MAFGFKVHNAKPNEDLKWSNAPANKLDLKTLRVAIVGGTAGIGQSLAQLFGSRGAEVVVVGRTFRDQNSKNVSFIKADLELMSEAKRVAQVLAQKPLDLVIFTTGILAAPKREETTEGLERDIAVSYLSRLVIVRNLLPHIEKSHTNLVKKPRVFIYGFPCAGEKGSPDDLNSYVDYEGMKTHMATVAGNEALVHDTARRFPSIAVYGVNPGLIKTAIRNNFLGARSWKSFFVESAIGLLFQNTKQYAVKNVPMMVAPELDDYTAAFFDSFGKPILSDGFPESYVEKYIRNSEELLKKSGVPYY